MALLSGVPTLRFGSKVWRAMRWGWAGRALSRNQMPCWVALGTFAGE